MPTSVIFTGWKEFEAKLKNMPATLMKEFDGEAKEAANNWAGLAKNTAPVDVGFLAGGISTKKTADGLWEVTSNAKYSAYMEWGTKGRVKVPADLSGYASQFRGKGGGDYYEFLNAILDWVVRKGIANRYSVKTKNPIAISLNKYGGKLNSQGRSDYDRLHDTARAIALSIIRHGVRPHPFFFMQKPIVEKQFVSNIKAILNREH